MNVLAEQEFAKRWGEKPEVIAFAPGRVNLIGEHTDYNGGFVLPVAVNRYVWVAASRNPMPEATFYAVNFQDEASFPLDGIAFNPFKPWSNYVQGVAWVLREEGFKLPGIKAVIGGDVPIGAGMSSSAAVEVAIALAFLALAGVEPDREKLALLCQRAENEFVGMRCGIMDQWTSLLAREGHAIFLDCLTLEYHYVPLPAGISIVVADTRVRRELARSEYNLRRKQCEEAVAILRTRWPQVRFLRDVKPEEMPGWEELLPEPIKSRAKHVVEENARVLEAKEALEKGNLRNFGRLMVLSHKSLRELYEVSSPELDFLVETAMSCEGVYGSRLTGAGFGGCTVTLVEESAVPALREKLREAYLNRFGFAPEIHDLSPVGGAFTLIGDQTLAFTGA
jgi:galactokinase